MSIPEQLKGKYDLPLIAAPMFLVSGVDLVVECCKKGVVGTFPALNQRTSEGFEAWLIEIETALASYKKENPEAIVAPYGVNIVVHETNTRFEADLALCIKHKVPIIISSIGNPGTISDKIHKYGGLVFHDVANLKHARISIAAGVDGLIVLTAGAGGHTGTLNPFAIVPQIRAEYDGMIILAGSLSDGRSLHAAEALGADFGYMGTRFIATKESISPDAFSDMIIGSDPTDIICTDKITGYKVSVMRQSLIDNGLDLSKKNDELTLDLETVRLTLKTLYSAGHGVGTIDDAPSVADLIDRIKSEYKMAKS